MNAFDKAEQARRATLFDQAQQALGKTKPILPIPVKKIVGPKDMNGVELKEGQRVARALTGDHAYIRVTKITKVDGDKVYLDNSKAPVKYPSRLLVL